MPSSRLMRRSIALAVALAAILVALGFPRPASAASGDLTWSPPVDATSKTGNQVFQQTIGLSADGSRAIASWDSYPTSGDPQVQAATGTIDGSTATWSTTVALETITTIEGKPQAVISADGTKAAVVWTGSSGDVRLAIADLTGTVSWSTAVTVASGYEPQASISADGSKIAILYRDGTNQVLARIGSISGTNATWMGASATLLGTRAGSSGFKVALAADGSKAAAIWIESIASNDTVQWSSATIVGTTVSWSTAAALSASGGSAARPRLALSVDGGYAIAVWRRFDGSNQRVQSRVATISGNAAVWSPVSNVSAAGQDSDDPRVALAAEGSRASVAWISGNLQSASATIVGGTPTWSLAVDVASASPYGWMDFSMSADATKGVMVWGPYDLGTKTASISVTGNSATWSSVEQFPAFGGQCSPSNVAMSADGTRATAVWSSYIPATNNCFLESSSAVAFSAPGAPTDVSATPGDGEITVSWNAPTSDGYRPIIRYTATAAPGGATCTTTGATSCTISGLTNGASYVISVVATNDIGDGSASTGVSATPTAAPSPPSPEPLVPVFTG